MPNSDIAKNIALKHNFFDNKYNKSGDFLNDYIDNGDGTITDRATGLMWEKEGSLKALIYREAKNYVISLNSAKFAACDNWRFPTIEELYSILEPTKQGKLFCHPFFICHDSLFWSIDSIDIASGGWEIVPQKVSMDIEIGTAYYLIMLLSNKTVAIAGGEGIPCLGIVRAVRTID